MSDKVSSSGAGATLRLAAFTAGLEYKHMPPATVDMAKRLLLDGIGCMIAGVNNGPARSAAAVVNSFGGTAQATILPGVTRGSVRDAAFVNGISLYSVGLNDIHKPAGAHPAGCVIPVVLAMGEWLKLPGEKLLTALAAGYELTGRAGRAIIPTHRERGFHPTGTCGTFGATAAAAHLLAFDAAQTASALGIAGSQAAGLYECHHDGTSTMIFHAGRAAQNGVEAALLAQAGMTGPATVLEGSKGFFRATSNSYDADAALADLGQRFELDATSFRPYFGCNSTISSSGATARLLRRVGPIENLIESIDVQCHAVVARDNAESDPHTLLAARLSLPFNVALVLVHGDVLTADLEEHEVGNERIRALLPKIKLHIDPAMPRYGARLTFKLKDGRVEQETLEVPRGSSDQPLTWDDIVEKFKPMVNALIAKDDQARIVDAVASVEKIDGATLMQTIVRAMPKH